MFVGKHRRHVKNIITKCVRYDPLWWILSTIDGVPKKEFTPIVICALVKTPALGVEWAMSMSPAISKLIRCEADVFILDATCLVDRQDLL